VVVFGTIPELLGQHYWYSTSAVYSTVHWSVVKRLWADGTEHAEVGAFKADENGGQVDQAVVECLRENTITSST
jgi:hypothetical protein